MNMLFKDGTPWTKKENVPFDVAMGAFDGSETCELIGLFLLKDLAKLNINVATNIGHRFLRILDKNFPKGHPLNKIFNRNSVKVSYRCTPNLSQTISAHNSKILNPKKENNNQKNCNCRKKENCPVGGQCLTKNVIYQATVNPTQDPDSVETYVGLTGNTF